MAVMVRVEFPEGVREVPCHMARDPSIVCSFNPSIVPRYMPTPDPMEGWEFDAVYPMGDQPSWIARRVQT